MQWKTMFNTLEAITHKLKFRSMAPAYLHSYQSAKIADPGDLRLKHKAAWCIPGQSLLSRHIFQQVHLKGSFLGNRKPVTCILSCYGLLAQFQMNWSWHEHKRPSLAELQQSKDLNQSINQWTFVSSLRIADKKATCSVMPCKINDKR